MSVDPRGLGCTQLGQEPSLPMFMQRGLAGFHSCIGSL